MKKVWNKETHNKLGSYYRTGDWGVEYLRACIRDPRGTLFRLADGTSLRLKVTPDGQPILKPNFTEIEILRDDEGSPIAQSWSELNQRWEATGEDWAKSRYRRYARELPVEDQLDAIWKQLNHMRLTGTIDLIQECDDLLGKRLRIKQDIPKP